MRSILSIGICLLVGGPLIAGPIRGTLSASFPTGDAIELPDGGALLKVGTPESRLTFSSAGTFDVNPGQAFFIGSFKFENESLGDANSSEVFQTVFRFSNLEGIVGAQFNYELTLEQNPQNLVETITLDGRSETTFRAPTGEEYTLLLSGFSDMREYDPETYLTNSFEAEFCVDGEGFLFGAFVLADSVGPQVPEPSSLLLIGVGVGLAAVRRRVTKRATVN